MEEHQPSLTYGEETHRESTVQGSAGSVAVLCPHSVLTKGSLPFSCLLRR